MNKPAVTQILDIIEERLNNIRKANGYFFDARKIERSKLTPFTTDDLPAITFHPTRLTVVKTFYGMETKEFSVIIECYEMTRDRPFSDVASELAADIVHAINRDSNNAESPNLGGFVKSCDFKDYAYQIGEGQSPYCGIVALFSIVFESKQNDMEGIG